MATSRTDVFQITEGVERRERSSWSVWPIQRNPTNPSSALQLQETESAARSIGLPLHLVEARGGYGLPAAMGALS